MMQHHKWNLYDIEMMTPWERDVYSRLLIAQMKEEEERNKSRNSGR